MWSKRMEQVIITTVLAAAMLGAPNFAAPTAAQPSAFPTDWILLQVDGEEGGAANDHRDVQAVYYQVAEGYLFLRMDTRANAGWPGTGNTNPARFKWLLDAAGSSSEITSGGHIRFAEYLLMVEDLSNTNDTNFDKNNRDHVGEITLMDDFVNNENNNGFRQWDATNPPHYTNNTPAEGMSPSDIWRRLLGSGTPGAGGPQSVEGPEIGYTLNGNRVEMYVRLDHLADLPLTEICLLWATDQQDTNLDQAPCCDRPDSDLCVPITTTGTIVITKDTLPDSPQAFDFTAGPAPLQAFTLTGSPGMGDVRTFANVPPGTYTVGENALPSGWTFGSIICDEDGATAQNNTTVDLGTRAATIVLEPGETVTCQFVNVQSSTGAGEATIIIAKDAQPDGPAQFGFSGSGSIGAFVLDDTGPMDQKSLAFVVDAAASYVVTESALPAGWDLAAIDCAVSSPTSSGVTATPDLQARSVTISADLGEGDVITCTFVNRQRGAITVRKVAQGASPPQFDFTFADPAQGFALGNGASQAFPNLLPGQTYTVAETVAAGWLLTRIACDAPGATIDLATATATIPLGPGANVTCTFTNSAPASVTIRKDARPDDPQDFAFASGFGSFVLDDSGATDDNDAHTDTVVFDQLNPGAAEVRELAPPGWRLWSLVCDDPDGGTVVNARTATASVDIDPGEDITCVFGNQRIPPPAPAPALAPAGLAAALALLGLLAWRRWPRPRRRDA